MRNQSEVPMHNFLSEHGQFLSMLNQSEVQLTIQNS